MTSRSGSSQNAARCRETPFASTSASGFCGYRRARRPGTGSTTSRQWRNSGSSGAFRGLGSLSRTSEISWAFAGRETARPVSESSGSCGRGPMPSTAGSRDSRPFVCAWMRASAFASAHPPAPFPFSSALPRTASPRVPRTLKHGNEMVSSLGPPEPSACQDYFSRVVPKPARSCHFTAGGRSHAAFRGRPESENLMDMP